jgi:asparagine synthase (glutamine-hydrolysing)
LSLCHNYAAAYLSFQPVRDHTPYTRVRKVPPGQHIIIENGRVVMRRHWSPLAMTSISYRSDGEYDPHFLTLFSQAVARRSGDGAPILAHLSGGMDSTSIVCMSDHLRRSADHPIVLLDTMSFYDDSEASLNERNYFTITEAQRGKTGIHVNTAMSLRTFEPAPTHGGAYYIPGADSFSLEQENRLLETVWNRGYRVILSGIGGDEVLGGIPSGLPELADVLVSGDLRRFVKRSIAWCLVERRPLIDSMFETGYYTFRLYAKGAADNCKAPPWLSRRLKELIRHEERRRPSLGERLRALPHELDNAETWDYIMETLPHMRPQLLFRPEYRYPMLDKDLVEFLFSIPREQLVRPGRRRSLMRRALRGIVPEAILERRRKAFQLRASLNAFRRSEAQLSRLWDRPLLGDLGFIAVDSLKREFKRCVSGDAEWNQALMRTIAYELWLRSHHSDAYCHEQASPVSC